MGPRVGSVGLVEIVRLTHATAVASLGMGTVNFTEASLQAAGPLPLADAPGTRGVAGGAALCPRLAWDSAGASPADSADCSRSGQPASQHTAPLGWSPAGELAIAVSPAGRRRAGAAALGVRRPLGHQAD